MTGRAELLDMPGHLIRRLQQHATAAFQEAARAEGHEITPVQFAAMMVLADRPGLDQAGLARAIAYDRATIGGVVKRLLEKGVVSRVPAPDDKRAFQLELTPEGRSWLEELRPLIAEVQETILAGLSEDERALLVTLMHKVLPAIP